MMTDEAEAAIALATTRAEAAEVYARCLRTGRCLRAPHGIDWPALNRAIRARWSMHGLKWIKERAWKMATKLEAGQ